MSNRLGFVLGTAAAISFSALTLTACGGGGGGAEKLVAVNFDNCDQNPSVGVSAVSGNSTQTDFVESEFFQKPYDRYDLEAVLDASAVSTTDYVRSLGIALYKVPQPARAKSCPTYFNLSTPPKHLNDVWRKVTGGITNGATTLLGLFFEYCGEGGPGCAERGMVNATILVNELSDRWTLVHEMMHYNFNQARKADPNILTAMQLKNEGDFLALEFERSLDSYERMPNRSDLQNASLALKKIVVLLKDAFVRRSLEEVAIEGLLIHRWAKKELRNVGTKDDVWYMKASRDEFFKALLPFERTVAKLKTYARENAWPEITAELETITTSIEDSRDEVEAIIDTAEAEVRSMNGDDDEFSSSLDSRAGMRPAVTAEVDFDPSAVARQARDHLLSHDHDGLQQTFEKISKDIEKSLR